MFVGQFVSNLLTTAQHQHLNVQLFGKETSSIRNQEGHNSGELVICIAVTQSRSGIESTKHIHFMKQDLKSSRADESQADYSFVPAANGN